MKKTIRVTNNSACPITIPNMSGHSKDGATTAPKNLRQVIRTSITLNPLCSAKVNKDLFDLYLNRSKAFAGLIAQRNLIIDVTDAEIEGEEFSNTSNATIPDDLTSERENVRGVSTEVVSRSQNIDRANTAKVNDPITDNNLTAKENKGRNKNARVVKLQQHTASIDKEMDTMIGNAGNKNTGDPDSVKLG